MGKACTWWIAVALLACCGDAPGGAPIGDTGPLQGADDPRWSGGRGAGDGVGGGDGGGARGGVLDPHADASADQASSGGPADSEAWGDALGVGDVAARAACGDGVCGPGEGQCTCPADCGPCPGCCQGEVCRKGDTDDACGVAGEECGACAPGTRCDEGACICAPACATACGDDGCGGSCGACAPGETCVEGACMAGCTPQCGGAACGDDGCGGSCGACPQGLSCQAGACQPGPCAPSCAGKSCGDDGCGGSCGSCGGGQTCTAGACGCLPSCIGKSCGDDGCGGSCGTCDDGDGCNGLETCQAGACVTAATACPAAPAECGVSPSSPGPKAGVLTAAPAAGFRMVDQSGWAAATSAIDAIAAHPSVQAVSLADVLADLNRTATKVSSVPGVECFHTGFTWEPGDVNVDYWWPQGICGTASAYPDGAYQGRKVAIVTWYHKPELDTAGSPDKGVRVAIVDTTNLADARYRLALLVAPTTTGGVPTYGAVKVHAGGIAWYRDLLYVADTSNGLRVFDLTRILRVQTGDKDAIGKVSDAAGYHAAGYKYVIPQVTRYKLCGPCCARFSFVEADLSTTPPSLLAGEYSETELSGRLHRWPLDAATGRLLESGGAVQATEAIFPGVAKMQGAHSHDGKYFVATSKGASNGTLHVGTVGATLKKRGWVTGPEDLHWSPFSDNLWSLSEYPGKRWVFAVKSAGVWAGCP